MIDEKKIKEIVLEKLSTDDFLVDIKINKLNKIEVFVDNFKGISIEKCIEISKHIENNLDREKEDFELYVSSPGLDKPFKVIEQYKKNINKEVEILTTNNEKIKGILTAINNNEITIDETKKIKKEGHKKKQTEKITHKLEIDNIKSTKVKILFK